MINVVSLAIGISASLVIYLIVSYEFGFDKFEKDGDRIYRVILKDDFGGTSNESAGVPTPLPDAARNEITGLDWVAGFQISFSGNISVPVNTHSNADFLKDQALIIYADSNYFKMIPNQWLAGYPQVALNEAHKIVLTESKAKLYFPSKKFADIIGKEILFDDSVPTTISGIVKDLNENSDFNFRDLFRFQLCPIVKRMGCCKFGISNVYQIISGQNNCRYSGAAAVGE